MLLLSREKDRVLRGAISFLLLTATLPQAFAGFEDRKFDSVRIQVGQEIENLLISNAECSSIPDCQEKQILFSTSRSGGVAIQLWGIKNSKLLQPVLKICTSFFVNQSDMEIISVDIYSITMHDALKLPLWQFAKPEINVIFKKNK